ncbi:TPA: hypothetical protein NPO21_000431 [Klebsiella variicola subsp. variicola]|nr:hypothetical protein [Klebsiella variicola subsp. variicola]
MIRKKGRVFNNDILREKIISALNSEKYSIRSLGGIAKEVNVSEGELRKIIKNDHELSRAVKYMPFRSNDGKLLVMSKERFFKEASFKMKFMDFFASKNIGVKGE